MNWLTTTLGSSVGKKFMMALTGFAFLGFLAAHLAGNFVGPVGLRRPGRRRRQRLSLS